MARKKNSDPNTQVQDQAQDDAIKDAEVLEDTPIVVEETDQSGEQAQEESPVENSDHEGDDQSSDQAEGMDVALPTPKPRSTLWPLVLGGALAAGVGFVASLALEPQNGWFASSSTTQTSLERLEANDTALFGQVDDLTTALDAAKGDEVAQEDINALQNDLETFVEMFEGRTDALSDRLSALEDRPAVEVVGSEEIAAVYEAELADLRTALDAQRAEMLAIASDASAQLEEAAAKAAEVENNAATVANAAAIRSALSRVQAALDAGGPYVIAMNEIEATSDTAAPDALVLHAEDGVATLADLQRSFPDAARETLDLARSLAGSDQGLTGRLTTFLQAQTGARSVTPRSGDDPDAVLSRAEAALTDGRLIDALAELDGLPEDAKEPMTNWRDAAETRLTVLGAIDDWTSSLTTE